MRALVTMRQVDGHALEMRHYIEGDPSDDPLHRPGSKNTVTLLLDGRIVALLDERYWASFLDMDTELRKRG